MSGIGIGWLGFVAGLFVVGVLWGVWRAGEWLLQRNKVWSDAVGVIMAATVQRRDRDQTLGIILEQTIQALGAHSGTLHMVLGDGEHLALAHAMNVERLDWLAALPADDVLARLLGVSTAAKLFNANQLMVRWQALAVDRDGGVVAAPLGKHALMVLAWTSALAAERQLPEIQSIQRYAEQVLGEFADLEARAADIQALSASLNSNEQLTRTAAHDLSNKLAAIHSLLDMASDCAGLGEEPADLIKQAMEQVSLSMPLVDELSNPNRKLELEALQVEELTQLAAAMIARRRRERAVRFDLVVAADIPGIWGERLAVLRILDNLISNALKHNIQVPDLHVWLRVWAEGTRVLFEVGDNGVGITTEALPRLFEFGFYTDSVGKVKGHGLGLWSSRRLVEAMGGEIWASSEPGRETHFSFALPLVANGPETSGPATAAEHSLSYQLRIGEMVGHGH